MSASPEVSGQAALYDRLYGHEATPGEREALAPIRVRGWPTDRREVLIHMARRGGRLLEIGCGAGEVLATLAPEYDQVVGVEISPVRAARARRNLEHLPNVEIVTSAVEALPEQLTGTFDCIVWADVIEHIVDVVAAMRALAHFAAPDGQLVTVTPNVAFLPQRLRMLAGRGPNTAALWFPNEGFSANPADTVLMDAGHVHYFTYRQVEILYEIAGFRPTRRLGMGTRWSRLRDWWPTLLSGQVCVEGYYVGTGGGQL